MTLPVSASTNESTPRGSAPPGYSCTAQARRLPRSGVGTATSFGLPVAASGRSPASAAAARTAAAALSRFTPVSLVSAARLDAT
jgi:hypothetical protein